MSEENIYSFENPEYRHTYWHTCSHVLAQAVKRLHPEVKLAIGPAIDNGFYYDFDSETVFTPDVLEKIEAEMKKIVKEDLSLERYEMEPQDALDYFKEYTEDGTFKKLIKNTLLDKDTVTALVTTVPVAGLKEKQDAALATKLAEYKAGLSEKEIKAIVDATAAYGNEEPEDNTEYIRQLTAVTVESLPEETRIYDYTDVTTKDGIRKVDVDANIDGVGEATANAHNRKEAEAEAARRLLDEGVRCR